MVSTKKKFQIVYFFCLLTVYSLSFSCLIPIYKDIQIINNKFNYLIIKKAT